MITDVVKALQKTAEHFVDCARKKNWLEAKADYDKAVTVAVFMKLPEDEMQKLFGDIERDIQGLFPIELVRKTYYETTVRNSQMWKNRSFEEFRRGLQAGTLNLTRWTQG